MKRLLPLLFMLAGSASLAESGTYRVEVIIFRNLAVVADAVRTEELRSFSQFPSLEESELPDDLVALAGKSSVMDAAWRRLRSSKGYQPLIFAAWEQNRINYYPPMRIHDEVLLAEQLRPPTNIMIADLAAEDPLGAYMSSFYRLDGTLQLRRSRFLHLYLDLEYREQAPQASSNEGNNSESCCQNIYALKQNRQIRTGQMQYFDTPYFGALVLVSALENESLTGETE